MTKTILCGLGVLLLASSMVAAQDQHSSASQPDKPTTQAAPKPLTVFGKVSDNGKTLLTDIDSEWAVSNSDALKGLEGRRVTVKCYVDSEHSRIYVLSAKTLETKYAYRQGDSAFRR